jgi:hypothetical protein
LYFSTENEIFSLSQLSFIPILSYFTAVLWSSHSIGLYSNTDSKTEGKASAVAFKILSCLMICLSLFYTLRLFIDKVRILFGFLLFDFKLILQFRLFVFVFFVFLFFLFFFIVLFISILNYYQELKKDSNEIKENQSYSLSKIENDNENNQKDNKSEIELRENDDFFHKND